MICRTIKVLFVIISFVLALGANLAEANQLDDDELFGDDKRKWKFKNGQVDEPKTVLLLSDEQIKALPAEFINFVMPLNEDQIRLIEKDTGKRIADITVMMFENAENTVTSEYPNVAARIKSNVVELIHSTVGPDKDNILSTQKDIQSGKVKVVHRAYFEPVMSEKDFQDFYRIDAQMRSITEMDEKTIGERGWILGKLDRNFEYLKKSSSKQRAELTLKYKFFIVNHETGTFFNQKRDSKYAGPGGFKLAMIDGVYITMVPFISFEKHLGFGAKTWRLISPEFQQMEQSNPTQAKQWVKESLLDALELNYRAEDGKPRLVPDDRLIRFHENRKKYYSTVVLNEMESEKPGFRDQFLPKKPD